MDPIPFSKYLDAAVLRGRVLTKVSGVSPDESDVYLTLSTGEKIRMYHPQDCCECVRVFDIMGDFSTLLNKPLTTAVETVLTGGDVPSEMLDGCDESVTATIYTFVAEDGAAVVLRWIGSSNGYYSEAVQLERIA